MRRRLLIVPFTVKPNNPNPHLEGKLVGEHRRILRWAIEGCIEWQMLGGLTRPASVLAATDEYFSSQDLFTQWLSEIVSVVQTIASRRECFSKSGASSPV